MSDWVKTTLGDLVILQRGFDITKASQSTGLYPVISSSGVTSFHDQFMVEGPGVVIGRKGTLGTAFFVPENYWPHDTTLWVKDFKKNDAKFIYYLLQILALEKLDSGSANPTLNRNYAHLVKVAVPDTTAQKRIATVLSALDAKIDLNNRINAELEALAKTIYDYWFVQFDFPDANGRPYKTSGGKMVWNDALKREIPNHWEARPLSQLVQVSTTSVDPAAMPNKHYRHLSIPGFDETGSFVLESGATIGSNKFTVERHDLLVSKLNPWFNRVVSNTDYKDMICSTEFVVWRCGDARTQAYLHAIATHPRFIAHCTQSATGTSNSHKRVNPQVMMRYLVPHAPAKAAKFAELVAPMLARRVGNVAENSKLTRLRDWLLPLLMNGQVRVA